MSHRRRILATLVTALCLTALACAPEVGSERWCDQMDETPKGEWTANQAADYAKNCVLRR